MLDDGGNDVIPLIPQSPCRPDQGEIVRLCAPAGEGDFPTVGSEQRCDLLSRLKNCIIRGLAVRMGT